MKLAPVIAAFTLFASLAIAQTPDPSTSQQEAPPATIADTESQVETPFDIFNNERLTGDWWGARSWLEDKGIEFGFALTTVYQHNVNGGLQTHHGHRTTGSFDYEVTFNLETMGLWKGGTVYLAGDNGWNDGIGGDRVGSYFGVNDDAGGDYSVLLSDAWFEQMLWEGKARVRIGKINLGSDFDANAYANDQTSQFLNSALVNAQNMPAPDNGLGIQVVIQPYDWMFVSAAISDAQSNERETGFITTFHEEDYFYTQAEIGFMPVWNTGNGNLPGAYRLGLWYDPQPKGVFFDDLGGRRRTTPVKRDDVGFYFNMDQVVYKENPTDDTDSQGLGVFARYAYAHEECNEVEHFWSVGAQYQGLIPTRDDDVLGFGFAQGILSGQMRRLQSVDRESVYELYYNAAVLPWLTVTPDVQYIVNPGAAGGRDCLVAGLRFQMTF